MVDRAAVAVAESTPDVADVHRTLDAVFTSAIHLQVEEAEQPGRFPRSLIESLGREGIFEAKWRNGANPDLVWLVALAERLGHLGSAGISVGVSLHDSGIAILRRFAHNDYLRGIAEAAIRGEAVVCIGASEDGSGSDLQNVTSTATSEGNGYRAHAASIHTAGLRISAAIAPDRDTRVERISPRRSPSRCAAVWRRMSFTNAHLARVVGNPAESRQESRDP